MSDFDFQWGEYVSVADKRKRAERELAKLRKRGRAVAPVAIEGRKIAKNFWGVSWCSNLERYSDFASRLPRGRSYVCNGLVIDLQIEKGRIAAKVSGSELYDVTVSIAPVAAKRWQAICRDCSGTIDSLVELLQGRLAKSVMDRVCRQGDGLFPAPSEIKLSCDCPDSAGMCKHIAATLYGVGARLDEAPRLLFVLRGVDENELLAGVGQDAVIAKPAPDSRLALAAGDAAALFGLDMADADAPAPGAPAAKPARPSSLPKKKERSAPRAAVAPKSDPPSRSGRARKAKAPAASTEGPRGGKRAGGRKPR